MNDFYFLSILISFNIFSLFNSHTCFGQGCKSSGRAGLYGPAQLKSSVFLKDFLMKIWTLLITHLKLSIILSKKMADIGKIFAEYWQKTARPSPLKFANWNGPARFVKLGIYNPGFGLFASILMWWSFIVSYSRMNKFIFPGTWSRDSYS